MNWWPPNLRDEAKMEGYLYFDKHIRKLPKNPDGSINEFSLGFADNDVDAFRHAYVSGVFTQEYGEKAADILGWLNELSSIGSPAGGSNMDLWNNSIGRKLGLKTKNRPKLAELVKKALENGELIISLDDPRKYTETVPPKPEGEHSVIVLKENQNGSNEYFYDFTTSKVLSRSEFVAEIIAGRYPGYGVRRVKGAEFPFSKRDNDPSNNLG
ncbi:MAG: hypothetical protein NTX25_04060 [Proteobacteria bacterium]|nr:hypothetical protein [Pseudomonadota bacterium]